MKNLQGKLLSKYVDRVPTMPPFKNAGASQASPTNLKDVYVIVLEIDGREREYDVSRTLYDELKEGEVGEVVLKGSVLMSFDGKQNLLKRGLL